MTGILAIVDMCLLLGTSKTCTSSELHCVFKVLLGLEFYDILKRKVRNLQEFAQAVLCSLCLSTHKKVPGNIRKRMNHHCTLLLRKFSAESKPSVQGKHENMKTSESMNGAIFLSVKGNIHSFSFQHPHIV